MKPISIMITGMQTISELNEINRSISSIEELQILLEIYKEKGMDGVHDALSDIPIGTDRMTNLVGYELRTVTGWRTVLACVALIQAGHTSYSITYVDEPSRGYVVNKNGYSSSHRIYQIRPPKKKRTKAQHEKEMNLKATNRAKRTSLNDAEGLVNNWKNEQSASKAILSKTQAIREAADKLGIPVTEVRINTDMPDFLEPAFPIIEDK